MDEACAPHGSDDKRIQNFGRINSKGEMSGSHECSLESSIKTGI